MNIKINAYQPHLANTEYIIEALEMVLLLHPKYEGSVSIDVDDLSMRLGYGYGTWKVLLTLHINGLKQTYSLVHHNEEWYSSQKMVYDPSVANSEAEQKEAIEAFQAAYEAIVDLNITTILSRCVEAVETEEEAQ